MSAGEEEVKLKIRNNILISKWIYLKVCEVFLSHKPWGSVRCICIYLPGGKAVVSIMVSPVFQKVHPYK